MPNPPVLVSHKNAPSGQIHVPHNWEVASEADLQTLTLVDTDLHKEALVVPTQTKYLLTQVAPPQWLALNVDTDTDNSYTFIAADIAERDSTAFKDELTQDSVVYVLDAAGDGSGAVGAAAYVYDLSLDTFLRINTRPLERVYTASAAIDWANGGIQVLTLTADTTLTLTVPDGAAITLHVAGGDAWTVTWPTIKWVGGAEPTLTADDVIEFWAVDSVIYGAYVGSVA